MAGGRLRNCHCRFRVLLQQYFAEPNEEGSPRVDRAGITAAIANFAVGGLGPGVPDIAIDRAERAVVDTVGVTLAAGREETVSLTRSHRGRLPAGPAASGGRFLPAGNDDPGRESCLLNGTAAHALDYDDVADSMKGHPSAVLVPTALAVGEEVGASGMAVLGAICVGFQIECALLTASASKAIIRGAGTRRPRSGRSPPPLLPVGYSPPVRL